jgi:hypothetical protein
MSVKNVQAFFEKVEKEKGLQAKLKVLAKKRKAHNKAAVAELVKIAAETGLTFTAADFDRVRGQATGSRDISETESELKRVAPKKCPSNACTWHGNCKGWEIR